MEPSVLALLLWFLSVNLMGSVGFDPTAAIER